MSGFLANVEVLGIVLGSILAVLVVGALITYPAYRRRQRHRRRHGWYR